MHPLEGNGALVNMYYYLWKKKLNRIDAGLDIRIPTTIVYENNFPKGCYFWTKGRHEPNRLERKVGKEVHDVKFIYSQFCAAAKGQELDIVASYLSSAEDAHGKNHTVVEYFNREELHEFLTKRSRRDQGILQKFVHPLGTHNVTIQAVWSPHIMLVEKRENRFALRDRRYPLFQRAVTYDGPQHYSQEAFVAPHIESEIKSICNRFTDHFYQTEHVAIHRMVLYFKVDPNSELWLLWASSIRIIGKERLDLTPRFYTLQPAHPEGAPGHRHNHDVGPLHAHHTNKGVSPRHQLMHSPAMPVKHRLHPHPPRRPSGQSEASCRHRRHLATARALDFDVTVSTISNEHTPGPPPLAAPDPELSNPELLTPNSDTHSDLLNFLTKPIPRNGSELWFMVRAALSTKFLQVLYACEQTSEFVDGLVYESYSHFMAQSGPFAFSLPDIVRKFFRSEFIAAFKPYGLAEQEFVGDFLLPKPSITLFRLQALLEGWKGQVCAPLRQAEYLLFRDHAKTELLAIHRKQLNPSGSLTLLPPGDSPESSPSKIKAVRPPISLKLRGL
eukprot:NODE_832_length_1823_cov_24.419811_g778_i0.p1 GENE.NODE_832_length_1823_cov_24.419811_g778_i0~~NODE_832_length_1823_cov_24.419811_g778_i0.p1  ORF type:complete len:557 (+),score=135.79 NODE_832_length_1823_cov_24.419811_g778_i0:59-1729(+)